MEKILLGFRQVDTGDYAPLTEDGYVQMASDRDMLAQMITGYVQTLPNEIDGVDGVDYPTIIFGLSPIATKAQALISAINKVQGVSNVIATGMAWADKANGILSFTFRIESIFGEIDYQMLVDPKNADILGDVLT